MVQPANYPDFIQNFPVELCLTILEFVCEEDDRFLRIKRVCKDWKAMIERVGDPKWEAGCYIKEYKKAYTSSINTHNLIALKKLLSNPALNPATVADEFDVENAAIRIASSLGYTDVVAELLKHPDVDPRARSNESLKLAIENSHLETVRTLLADKRIDPEQVLIMMCSRAENALQIDSEILNELLKHSKVKALIIRSYQGEDCKIKTLLIKKIKGFEVMWQAINSS
ncbi:MAG: hypothetical protein K0S74_990 [Chlamydiales bacterium]|jgi:hypothetical protein|nr:hypothetical protein [Chlamydiales bacterium]